MSRAKQFGPIFEKSLTRFGHLDLKSRASPAMKESFRLENQSHMRKDVERQRLYSLCKLCGTTTVLVNFDKVPSARIGLWGRCKGDKDYTHHRYVSVSQSEYEGLKEKSPPERLNWLHYER